MKIDAIAYWPPTNKAYFFREASYVRYRMSRDATHASEGAETVTDLKEGYWKSLAFDSSMDAVATVYPRANPREQVLYFFKGSEYVTYSIADDVALHEPKPIVEKFPGLPPGFHRDLDVVLYWPPNGKMYFFKGDSYIRYNLEKSVPENPPSKIVENWPGLVFTEIDACLIGKKGIGYFFKGDQYIRYSLELDRAMGPPALIDAKWPGLVAMLATASVAPANTAPTRPEADVYADVKSFYTLEAKVKARTDANGSWIPEEGFHKNRRLIVGVYDYYRDLYLERPAEFLWAGLGRMAGGVVVGGLDNERDLSDPALQVIMVRIGKDIFHDLAWQHEAYLAEGEKILEYAAMHDRHVQYAFYDQTGAVGYAHVAPRKSYREAWEKIISGVPASVAEGNRDLLENEQWSVVQPQYDHMRTLSGAGFARPMTGNVHPYHRAFIEDFPTGEPLVALDRWAWITREPGMWSNWLAAGEDEQTRLVSIDFGQLCIANFGRLGRPDLIVGAP